ncbi:hypothetical protein P7K49_026595, partial [Saguinus oedipus]
RASSRASHRSFGARVPLTRRARPRHPDAPRPSRSLHRPRPDVRTTERRADPCHF